MYRLSGSTQLSLARHSSGSSQSSSACISPRLVSSVSQPIHNIQLEFNAASHSVPVLVHVHAVRKHDNARARAAEINEEAAARRDAREDELRAFGLRTKARVARRRAEKAAAEEAEAEAFLNSSSVRAKYLRELAEEPSEEDADNAAEEEELDVIKTRLKMEARNKTKGMGNKFDRKGTGFVDHLAESKHREIEDPEAKGKSLFADREELDTSGFLTGNEDLEELNRSFNETHSQAMAARQRMLRFTKGRPSFRIISKEETASTTPRSQRQDDEDLPVFPTGGVTGPNSFVPAMPTRELDTSFHGIEAVHSKERIAKHQANVRKKEAAFNRILARRRRAVLEHKQRVKEEQEKLYLARKEREEKLSESKKPPQPPQRTCKATAPSNSRAKHSLSTGKAPNSRKTGPNRTESRMNLTKSTTLAKKAPADSAGTPRGDRVKSSRLHQKSPAASSNVESKQEVAEINYHQNQKSNEPTAHQSSPGAFSTKSSESFTAESTATQKRREKGESLRYIAALQRRLEDLAQGSKGVKLPALCSCAAARSAAKNPSPFSNSSSRGANAFFHQQEDPTIAAAAATASSSTLGAASAPWEHCANNCVFYKNPQAYAKELADLFRSLELL
mmetsp:Transcript_10324/g.20301  ORF Transcript_10324/g.20301 Transcript_10324/m.20301 type:complete len:619 (-) Transcript_10324:2200-4056(-)